MLFSPRTSRTLVKEKNRKKKIAMSFEDMMMSDVGFRQYYAIFMESQKGIHC